jgi:GAF domain-containing protein
MVPAHMRGPDMGMLVVYYQTVHVFTPSERRFYSVLADITSVSLERTMLRQRTESQLSQELTVGDIVRKLRSSLDPDTIMRTAVQELGQALGAEMTSIEVTGPVHDTSDLLSGSSKRSKSA